MRMQVKVGDNSRTDISKSNLTALEKHVVSPMMAPMAYARATIFMKTKRNQLNLMSFEKSRYSR
jgi:hypothetical protein